MISNVNKHRYNSDILINPVQFSSKASRSLAKFWLNIFVGIKYCKT